MTRIVISYAWEDRQAAASLARDLRQAGLDPWLEDEDIRPGHDRVAALAEAITASDYFITIISSRSVSATGVINGTLLGRLDILFDIGSKPRSKVLIPVRLDEVPLPPILMALNSVDMFPSWEKGFNALLRAVKYRDLGAGIPTIIVAWDPEVFTQDEYSELIAALGDLARAEGCVGIERVSRETLEVSIETGVLV